MPTVLDDRLVTAPLFQPLHLLMAVIALCCMVVPLLVVLLVLKLQGPKAPLMPPPHPGVEDRLQSLARLKAQGLVNDQEYEAKRQHLLAEL